MRYIWAVIVAIAIIGIVGILAGLWNTFIDLHTETNINNMSQNEYVLMGLTKLIPLLIMIWLVKLSWRKITYEEPAAKSSNDRDTDASLTKAVYNHAKDIAAEVKPAINEYKQKHTISQVQVENQDVDLVDEDTIYEQVMLEIEEDRKVKSTWAKALAQSDGDREKTEALYIKLRVQNIIDTAKERKLKNFESEKNIIKIDSTEIKEDKKSENKETESKRDLLIFGFMLLIIVVIFYKLTFSGDKQDVIELSYVQDKKEVNQNSLIHDGSISKDFSIKNFSNTDLEKKANGLYDKKNYAESKVIFEELIVRTYKPASTNYMLGEIEYYKNNYAEAIAYFKKSAILNDKATYMPTLLLHAAMAMERSGDKKNAKIFYGTVVSMYPQTSEADMAKKELRLK